MSTHKNDSTSSLSRPFDDTCNRPPKAPLLRHCLGAWAQISLWPVPSNFTRTQPDPSHYDTYLPKYFLFESCIVTVDFPAPPTQPQDVWDTLSWNDVRFDLNFALLDCARPRFDWWEQIAFYTGSEQVEGDHGRVLVTVGYRYQYVVGEEGGGGQGSDGLSGGGPPNALIAR